MEGLKQNKGLIIALAVTLLIGAVYYLSRGDTAEIDGPLLEVAYTTSPETQEVLEALRALEGFKLSTALFDDPAFLSLEDLSVSINPVTPGRRNPFTPL